MKNTLKATLATILTAALVAVSFALPASANAVIKTLDMTHPLDVKQVEEMQVINRDLHASYNVTSAADRTAIVTALSGHNQTTSVTEKSDGLRLLNIRMKDGSKFNYWVHTNAVMIDDMKYAPIKALTDVMNRCEKNYPANIEWLGYMNPYRITKMTIADNGYYAVYESALSDSARQSILNISDKLKAVKVGSVTQSAKKDKEIPNGSPLYLITMEFENGKEGYTVRVDSNQIAVRVDSIDYVLTYTPNDKVLYKALTDSLAAAF